MVLLAAAPAVAQTDTAKALADMVSRASGSLAAVRYTVTMETGSRNVLGQGICISNDKKLGVFLTTALDPRLKVDTLKDFELLAPGLDSKPVKAKLLGIDPWTGLGFLQATEAHDWQVVQFMSASSLTLGQQVMSVGLMMGDPSRPVSIGVAYVGAKLRVPGELVRVAGGRLTGTCSPVFNAAGQAIGIVGRQLFLSYQMPTRRGMVPMRLRSQEEAVFFTPVEEFVHVLKAMPTGGKVARLPWMGVNKFEAVSKDLMDILKLTAPAVKLDEVLPDQPAAKAGLSNRDIIIEVDGKPIEKLATPELSVRNFVRQLMRRKTGTALKLKIISGGTRKDVTVTLADMPMRPSEAPRYFNKAIGLLVREKVTLDEFLDRGPSAKIPGLIVLGVIKDGPAAKSGLQAADLITNINNQPVKRRETFKQIVETSLNASRTAPINFLVRRGSQAQMVTVNPGR
jgi:serine protease Do